MTKFPLRGTVVSESQEKRIATKGSTPDMFRDFLQGVPEYATLKSEYGYFVAVWEHQEEVEESDEEYLVRLKRHHSLLYHNVGSARNKHANKVKDLNDRIKAADRKLKNRIDSLGQQMEQVRNVIAKIEINLDTENNDE